MKDVIERLRGGLTVSCQAEPASPLRNPLVMAAMAGAAELGGATTIRAQGVGDIAAIRASCPLPVIGLIKRRVPGYDVFITPAARDADAIAEAGAAVIAMDGTSRPRPDGDTVEELIRHVHERYGLPVMADIDSVESARQAVGAGADIVGSTLAGYTAWPSVPGPDIDLVARLVEALDVPVIAEGRYTSPDQVRAAFAAGAHAVVIGGAITDTTKLTERFTSALPAARSSALG
jgi:N-acylglucosamine-6-phosphate 2-epimerase